MPRKHHPPLFSDPSFPVLETGVDIRKIYSGNRVLARCAGAGKRWLVQCLLCSRRLIRRESTLLDGRGLCSCRNKGSSRVPRCIKFADKMSHLMREKREWNRIIRFYGEKVVPRWREDFLNFVNDMGRRPKGKYICRRTSICVVGKRACYWGTKKQAEWPSTIYLPWNNRTRRLEEIPPLQGIPRELLLSLISRTPKYRLTGETIVKRWQKYQSIDALKKHRKERSEGRNRLQGGD